MSDNTAPRSSIHRVTLRRKDPNTISASLLGLEILLDDIPIKRATSIILNCTVGQINKVVIEMYADLNIDINTEIL